MRTERLRAALPLETARKSAALCGTALAVLGVAATSAVATASPAGAAGSGYASYDLAGDTVTFPVADAGGVHVTTDSVNAQTPSGASAFLNANTPFGRRFGSSQNKSYLLVRQAPGNTPSTTVISFDRPFRPGSWGFALGDVDAEAVAVQAFDVDGRPVPVSGLGFRGTFTFCQPAPLPGTCKGMTGADQPTWNPGTGELVGNAADTDGASAWAVPTAPIASLVLTSRVLVGLPAYQLWIAADDQPKAAAEAPAAPVTAPGEPITLRVCDGTATHIDLIGDPAGGKVVTHPEDCTVTYTPDKGFRGKDTFAVEIHTPDGKVFVRTLHVRVGAALAATGVGDLLALAVLAAVLLAAGFVLTIGVQRAGREHSWDTIDS